MFQDNSLVICLLYHAVQSNPAELSYVEFGMRIIFSLSLSEFSHLFLSLSETSPPSFFIIFYRTVHIDIQGMR